MLRVRVRGKVCQGVTAHLIANVRVPIGSDSVAAGHGLPAAAWGCGPWRIARFSMGLY